MFRKKDGKMSDCKKCGKVFKMRTYNNKFCSNECRNDYFNEKKAIAVEYYDKHISTQP